MKQYVSKFSGKELDERLTKVDNIPTKTSELNNDSGFISEVEADNKYTDKNKTGVLEKDIKDLKNRIDVEIPTKISQLKNDKNYITDSEVQNKLNNLNNTVDYFGDIIELNITSKGGNIDSVEVNEGVLVDTLLTKANLDENGKIIVSQLPDYILGQVMFGGLIYSNGTITASSNFKSKYGNDTNISASEASKYNGVYFIVTGEVVNMTIAGVSQVSTGDWIISVGDSWKKIDNSDAVTSVAGLVGNVNASSLAAVLSDITDSNSLARKTDLPKKLSELEADIEIGSASDWNASEEELGYIKNRTHFSKVIHSENVIGDTGDYLGPILIGEASVAYLRITSDYMSDMVRVKDGEVVHVDPNGNYAILHFDGMNLDLEIIREDPAGYDGNFHLEVIEYNPLDDKYIPETIVRASKDGYLYSNGEKVDMRFTRSLLPVGTSIPASANLNTIEFLKIGKYYCSLNADAKTIKNCPVNVAFSMEVFNPLGINVDDETTRDYTYRIRVITQYDTGQQYMQFCRTNGTAGSWVYESWYVTPRVKFALASSKNDGSAAIGATNKGVYVDSTGEIKAMSYTVAKSVPSNAVFTDTNTKVTAVGNHYTPSEDESQQIDAPSGEVVTGIKRDAAGHIVGVVTTPQTSGGGSITEDQLIWTKVEGEAGVRLKGTNGTATGNLAISAGDDKTASDGTAFASVASGDHAVVFGFGNTCAGRSTLAQGLYNIVNGKDSVAFGQRNLVNGDQAFATGQQNEVTARLGVAIGYKNKATNTDSIAIGYQNTSSGSASVAMGDTCEATGTSSTAMGYKTKATGAYTSTFGQNTQATNDGEVAMGLFNKSTTSTEASEQTLFSFGIGTSDTNRVNAFEIKKNGDVYIANKKISGDNIFITDFTVSDLEYMHDTPEGAMHFDTRSLYDAFSSNKVVLVPYGDGLAGYGIATGYKDDYLYVSIILEKGRHISLDIPNVDNNLIYPENIYITTFVNESNLKTINDQSIIGSGNIIISGGVTEEYVNDAIASAITTTLNTEV